MKTAVLLMVFNRPDSTQKVFEKIRQAQPRRLYIAADGPRDIKQNEERLCNKTRSIVMDTIDWKCEVKTLFRENNLGCRWAIVEAINWFFDNEEQGIILEDDCVPELEFFQYCENLLEEYKNKEEVMQIAGHNPFYKKIDEQSSYYFSKYPAIWGWATWKRAWKKFDPTMKNFKSFIEDKNRMKKYTWREKLYLNRIYQLTQKEMDAWDYQWLFALLYNDGLCIIPNGKMIFNVGTDANATHTVNSFIEPKEENNKTIKQPLVHPEIISTSIKYDRLFMKRNASIIRKVIRAIIKTKRKWLNKQKET